MTAAERFASHPPSRMQSHPPHEELVRSDPEMFRLHIEFVHAHGAPKGQFTTFSTRTAPAQNGARGK